METKTNIIDKVLSDDTFISILRSYKNAKTGAHKATFNDGYKNGLCNCLYLIEIDGKAKKIILPIFSTQKTVTWSFFYLKTIKENIPASYLEGLEDHEILNMVLCPLYFFDTISDDVTYMALISAQDFMNKGIKGKNGYSTYFWNKDLPNKFSKNKKELISDCFVMTLPYLSKDEIREICKRYATKYVARFGDTNERSEITKINNIYHGLYAQVIVYIKLLNDGHDVLMTWYNEDDLGIDIQVLIDGEYYNIDVKSTTTKDLRISKNRKETDFYAVCDWKANEPVLLGYLFKYDFWQSDINQTESPVNKDGMWLKPISNVKKSFVMLENFQEKVHTYNKIKMKQNEVLFNAR